MAQYLDYEGLKKYHGLIKGYIDENIKDITSFEYEIVTSLPEKDGEKGKIYLKQSSTSGSNQFYDEYIWIVNGSTGSYEFIGTTAVDLSNYYTKDVADGKFAGKSTATTSANGLMSSTDKTKLDGIQSGATAVSVTQTQKTGSEIGSVTVNGTKTTLYAPFNIDQKIASILLRDGVRGTESSPINNVSSLAFNADEFMIESASTGDAYVSLNITAITNEEIEDLFA